MKFFEAFKKKFLDQVTSETFWDGVLESSMKIILIIIASWVIVKIGHFIIQKAFRLRVNIPLQQSERRQRTIERLLQSVISYVVYFSALIAILSEIGLNISGLLAGAGIAGLAIGFGAQSLVKDVITGFFIIFEDQFGVGDYVQVNGQEGTVLEIGLRTTKIKGLYGETHIIPNGLIAEVVNYSLSNSIAYIDFNVIASADLQRVEKIITDYLETLPSKNENIVGNPAFLGVQNVVGGEITLRVTAETLPLQHYGVARMIRQDLVELFEQNHIPLPYPNMVIYDQDLLLKRKGEA